MRKSRLAVALINSGFDRFIGMLEKNLIKAGGLGRMDLSPSQRRAKPAIAKTTTPAAVGSFPVVGIGASAGGLEATRQLLKNLPRTPGMAFVVVQHLAATHASGLSAVLSRATSMPVSEARNNVPLEANRVYVIPPNGFVALAERRLRVTRRHDSKGIPVSIDHFLLSLAEQEGGRAIGVILSGTGSDGTRGLQAVKAAGGITFAQDEKSAKYHAMPASAIAAGCVDFVLPPRGIADELERVAGHPLVMRNAALEETEREPSAEEKAFNRILFDVSDRKRAETGLKESEERLRLALAGGQMGMWEMDLSTGRAYLDGLEARLLGLECPPRDFTNEQFLQQVHPEDREELRHKIRHAIQAGGDFQSEFRVLPAPHGEVRWLAATATLVRTEEGHPSRLLGVNFDITQRKQAEAALHRTHADLERRVAERADELARINQRLRVEIAERRQAEAALRESERALADFFEHATIGMQWLDRRGRVLRINQAALDMFGCSRDDCLQRPIAPFFADQRVFDELLDRLSRGETLRDFSARLQRADGTIRHLLINADGSRHKQRLVHTRWFIRDISERVLLQAEIVRASDRERQRIGQDLHDGLCQLLTGIRWKSQSLQQRLALSAPAEARRVRKITGLLTDAIKQARGVVRGLQPVENVPDGLMSALHQLASSTRELFGVACQCDVVRPVLVSEQSAATDLFRIAQEAINNAIKHGRARKIQINLAQNNGDILLTVTNDGRPFPRRSGTTGVGLRIMQNRARRIGAALQFSAGARGGTIVTCSMPVSETGRTGAAFS